MFESGDSNATLDVAATASELGAALAATQVSINRLDAQRVHYSYDVLDLQLSAEAVREEKAGDGDHVRASRTASCDVADALSLSNSVVSKMIDAGEQLWHRLPLVDAEFSAGNLDYARVQVITGILRQACDTTINVIEPDVVAAAHLYTPVPLRDAIWQLWADHDPREAAAARDTNQRNRSGVYQRKRNDGSADVIIATDDASANEFTDRIAELVATVCEKDLRTRGERQAAAATAMVRESNSLECLCGRGECPFRDNDRAPARVTRIAAFIDIETLLGLTSNPPTLGDGTPLPPDVARLIATDAQWQLILTDMLTLAGPDIARRAEESNGNVDLAPTGDSDPESPTVISSNSVSAPLCLRRVRVMRRRSRTYIAPPLPDPDPEQVHKPVLRGWHAALLAHIAALLADIADKPWLANGLHPDGHGGHDCPPEGALTYRPGAELSALVRARYRTCTAAGCRRPSESCQLDHVVEFDHKNPLDGGWTIFENLQPLCLVHHQAKTEKHWRAAFLAGGFVCWRTGSGAVRITAPAPAVISMADLAFADPAMSEPDPEPNGPWRRKLSTPLPDDIEAPTWWERHHINHLAAEQVTLRAIAQLKNSKHRNTARQLRNKYLEHQAVVKARYLATPPPF